MSPISLDMAEIMAGLALSGISDIVQTQTVNELVRTLKTSSSPSQNNLIIVSLDEEYAGLLLEFQKVSAQFHHPIILFLNSQINVKPGALIDAGICSVIVDGLAANRIPYLLETTVHRYKKMKGMEIELHNARDALQDRKLIEKAKGLLMAQRKIDESTAYQIMRSAAMNQHCKIKDIAHSIIIASKV